MTSSSDVNCSDGVMASATLAAWGGLAEELSDKPKGWSVGWVDETALELAPRNAFCRASLRAELVMNCPPVVFDVEGCCEESIALPVGVWLFAVCSDDEPANINAFANWS